MLNNAIVGAHFQHLDLNVHTTAHLFRAVQEGIAFSFRYGLDIMRENNIQPAVIRAGKANMFLSEVFTQSFVNATGVPVELYHNDGSVGAAIGAGIGAKYFTEQEAFVNIKPLSRTEPVATQDYNVIYGKWKNSLQQLLQQENDTL
jgi:xylulokinase